MLRLAGSVKLRAMNESAALGHLVDTGELTRADLCRLTGLSKPTVSDVLRRLTNAGLAVVNGHRAGGPGPRAEVYGLNPDAAYVLGVSALETTDTPHPAVVVALADVTGRIRARAQRSMVVSEADPVVTIAAAVRDLCDDCDVAVGRVSYLQLAVPGSYNQGTGTINHVDIEELGRPGLVGELADALGIRVGVDNNVNLAAVAERRRGVARDTDSFVLMWLADGIGLAIDLDGTVLRGARGGAGEIGYMPVGLSSMWGRGPDLHDTICGEAVLALAREHSITDRTPAEAVARADPRMLAELAERIALGVATVVTVLDPDVVVLAGEVGRAGGQPLRDAVDAAVRRAVPLDVDIAITQVDDDPVLLGALDAGLATVHRELIEAVYAATGAAEQTRTG